MAVKDSADGEEVEPEYPERWSWEEAARDLLHSVIELERDRLTNELNQLQSKIHEGERVTVEDVWHVKNQWLGLRYRLDVLEHAADREHPTDESPPEAPLEYAGEEVEAGKSDDSNPDEQFEEPETEDPGELNLDPSELRIVGQTTTVEETDASTVELQVDGETVAESGARGEFALLWVPIDPE